MIWEAPKEFSKTFLRQHHDHVLVNTFHRIKAYILYPLGCGCIKACRCEERRQQVILSLNVAYYNHLEDRCDDLFHLSALRHFLRIPEDRFFRRQQEQVYPLWLIKEKFQEQEAILRVRIIDRLVWTLLRLAATYKAFPFAEPRASVHEAVEIILGKNPLKSILRKADGQDYLCGEKGYSAQFTLYKPVCHFIAAFRLGKPFSPNSPCLTVMEPEDISIFLKHSHWLRCQLLCLETPNIKEKRLFTEDTLLPLPSWVDSHDIHIPIDPFPDKLQAIIAQARSTPQYA
jgi:hypothetical protein